MRPYPQDLTFEHEHALRNTHCLRFACVYVFIDAHQGVVTERRAVPCTSSPQMAARMEQAREKKEKVLDLRRIA